MPTTSKVSTSHKPKSEAMASKPVKKGLLAVFVGVVIAMASMGRAFFP
jgi:hypothetical protein